jgi:hypothetical protein
VDDALCGRRTWDDALADYERRRNGDAMPMYEFTYAQSSLEPPPPPMLELLAALSDDPAGTDRFFGVFAGTVPVEDFFGAPAVPATA